MQGNGKGYQDFLDEQKKYDLINKIIQKEQEQLIKNRVGL